MKVLVGIVTHNRATILPKAIESALAQDYLDKEVAVFDDASTDSTPQLREQFPQVRWHQGKEKQGYLPCRNYLMQNTNADFYVSLDDDAWFIQGDELTQGVKVLKQQPNVAALAYDILSPDQPTEKERQPPYPTNMFIGCGHMLRLQAVRNVGYYTPSPGYYGSEEKDICVRLLAQQQEIWRLPGIHVWHDKTMLARNMPEQHRSDVCNDLVFAYRRCPFPMIAWLLPAKMISHLRFALSQKLLRSYLAGLRCFVEALPAVLPTRQPVDQRTFQEFRRRSRLPL